MTAYERPDRGNTVWLRWGWGGGAPRQRATTIKLRDESGQVVAAREAEALAVLALAANALAAGLDPAEALSPSAPPELTGPMTLRQGFDRALELEGGRGYYDVVCEPWRQARTYSDDLCEILGANTLWRTVTEDTAAQVWRKYADWHNAGATRKVSQGKKGSQVFKKGGHDTARRSVWWLYVVAKRVARIEHRMPPDPPRNQRQKLEKVWLQKTGHAIAPQAERFTDDEVASLFAALPKADPRLRLALGLALESRLGQVIRGKRSHLNLAPNAGALGHGVLVIHGASKKLGTLVDLTADQRSEIDRAMAPRGMLAAMERARVAGLITDYPLFPGGRLPIRGEARETLTTHWTSTGLRGAMIDLQKAASVTAKPGRGLYGLRRWAADRAEDFSSDERALNVITSHAHTSTRRGYQDPEHLGARRAAAEVRQQLRSNPVKKAPEGAEPTPEPTPS